MKSRRLILLSLSGLALMAGLSQFAGCAKSAETAATPAAPAKPAAPVVPTAGLSPTSANISSHLESGGEFYAVMDLKGETEQFGNLLADLIAEMAKQSPGEIPANLDFRALFKKLGLYNIDGLGMSSWKDADGLHHNRVFVYTPNGRIGLLKIYGDKPGPYTVPTLAPADADLAFESTLDLKSLFDLILGYAGDIGGPDATKEVNDELKTPIPETTLTAQNIIDHLNTKLIVIARADTKNLLQVSPDVKVPMTDFLIALDGFSDILDQLDPVFKDDPMFTVGAKNGMKTVTVEMPFPDPFTAYKIEIIGDPKTKRLYIVSRDSFADETIFGKGPRLSSSPDFKTATDGLPTEGNAMSYISKNGAAAFVQYYDRQVMTNVSKPVQDAIISFEGLDKLPHGLASAQVNLPDGMLMQGTSTLSPKDAVFLVPLAAVGVVAAAGVSGFENAMGTSTSITMASGSNMGPGGNMGMGADVTSQVIKNNLRQISTAAQQYMLDHGVTQVTYQELTSGATPALKPVAPVAGEDYNNLIIRQSTTRITVTTADGQVVSFDM